ncbi:hypothetical protein PCANC_03188 [Puccinia coronata f. sp. avenae]|uniref:Uncharacterized protein n=1 Tax=Puccinia coronata f. sp. avenae TaxID=200324 RepID=A0A2N5T824_9BASI|nr:hypothetical protein PCANC_03188 [Puccinia coronata f. sp. avenae]
MELVGSLIMGHTHSLLSRSLYSKIRAILSLCDVNLPAWATIQASRARIRNLLNSSINYSQSPFGTPTFSLSPQALIAQDVANPLISKNLDFYPELTKDGAVYKFSQSHKWLKYLQPAHRPQMCESKLSARALAIDERFLIEEGDTVKLTIPQDISFDDPILSSVDVMEFDRIYSEIVLANGVPLMVACGHRLVETNGSPDEERLKVVPNPWRLKANGKIMRHVPITLYANDTSGNVSKQFNKHISFYFTLSGLPPRLSNQEFNCHFLSSSNVASVLELSEQIVDQLNLIAEEGFIAYDNVTSQVVLVNLVVLCFLADSPMHAEVTNTPIPGQANHPCRMCTLSVEYKHMMKSVAYIQQVLQVDDTGHERLNAPRQWRKTLNDTHALYDIATTQNITLFRDQSTLLGVKDTINTRFVTESRSNPALKLKMEGFDLNCPGRLYDPFLRLEGFDGVLDTPVEVLHVVLLGIVKYLACDDIGKLKDKEKAILISRLDSLNTLSLNIESLKGDYLIKHIKSLVGRHFKIILQAAPFVLFDLLSPTRQWINKPKIHMLIHLPESILRFGPASLFSTEKFESYNGVLRQASIHSNRLSPGRDLAVTFDNYSSLKFLVSGGVILDQETGATSAASSAVQDVFTHNPLLQRAMGYNNTSAKTNISYPYGLKTKVAKEDKFPPPQQLTDRLGNVRIAQVAQLMLSKHDLLKRGVHLVFKRDSDNLVGLVESMWAMTDTAWSNRQDYYYIIGVINVQHNCHRFQCPVVKSAAARMEREITSIAVPEVRHKEDNHFIINSASLSNPELHRLVAALPHKLVSPLDWMDCVRGGYTVWVKTPDPPEGEGVVEEGTLEERGVQEGVGEDMVEDSA